MIAFIESHYSAQADREHRAIAELSMGGARREVTNPILWADVPDPSGIRVGDTYYRSSTIMQRTGSNLVAVSSSESMERRASWSWRASMRHVSIWACHHSEEHNVKEESGDRLRFTSSS